MGLHECWMWMAWQGMAVTHAMCTSSALWPHWTSLMKHKLKDKIIKNFKMVIAEHSTKHGVLPGVRVWETAQVPCPWSWPHPQGLGQFCWWVKIFPKVIIFDLGLIGQMEVSQAEKGRPNRGRRSHFRMRVVVKLAWLKCLVPRREGQQWGWIGELEPGWKCLCILN